MEKPHRFILNRVSNVADEAAAFLRRRRVSRRPFARVHLTDGRVIPFDGESEEGRELFLAASALIDAATVDQANADTAAKRT